MTFTLTGPLISAFALGVLSSAGVWLLVKFWLYTLREMVELIVIPIAATAFAIMFWSFLFVSAFA